MDALYIHTDIAESELTWTSHLTRDYASGGLIRRGLWFIILVHASLALLNRGHTHKPCLPFPSLLVQVNNSYGHFVWRICWAEQSVNIPFSKVRSAQRSAGYILLAPHLRSPPLSQTESDSRQNITGPSPRLSECRWSHRIVHGINHLGTVHMWVLGHMICPPPTLQQKLICWGSNMWPMVDGGQKQATHWTNTFVFREHVCLNTLQHIQTHTQPIIADYFSNAYFIQVFIVTSGPTLSLYALEK